MTDGMPLWGGSGMTRYCPTAATAVLVHVANHIRPMLSRYQPAQYNNLRSLEMHIPTTTA